MNDDLKFLKEAIKKAKESFEEGCFPAGSVLVKNNEVIFSAISAKFPEINFHAESKTIDLAMNTLHEQLTGCVLYSSMEPCLMCMSRAYWGGIRKIVFSLSKAHTIKNHYESDLDHYSLAQSFNEKMELIHIAEFENEALELVKKWENLNM